MSADTPTFLDGLNVVQNRYNELSIRCDRAAHLIATLMTNLRSSTNPALTVAHLRHVDVKHWLETGSFRERGLDPTWPPIDLAAAPAVDSQNRPDAPAVDDIRAEARRAALEEAARIADAYAERMWQKAKKREAEGKPFSVAECKEDAGISIAAAIREAAR